MPALFPTALLGNGAIFRGNYWGQLTAIKRTMIA
jgi:hypothetical protein